MAAMVARRGDGAQGGDGGEASATASVTATSGPGTTVTAVASATGGAGGRRRLRGEGRLRRQWRGDGSDGAVAGPDNLAGGDGSDGGKGRRCGGRRRPHRMAAMAQRPRPPRKGVPAPVRMWSSRPARQVARVAQVVREAAAAPMEERNLPPATEAMEAGEGAAYDSGSQTYIPQSTGQRRRRRRWRQRHPMPARQAREPALTWRMRSMARPPER